MLKWQMRLGEGQAYIAKYGNTTPLFPITFSNNDFQSHLKMTPRWKNGVTCNYENIIKNSKVFFSFKKRKNTGSTRKCQISASLKEKVSLIFHGESDVSLLEKLIASTSYILPLMDAVQVP
ncbi:hypothetical protein POVWA2_029300 [Plasmodium ovale wallikeri]|uniref:Uncharacterized protein n=1 Tax=Plasmodium ovale wallikeri TaxID=864142 RepID=A0A1A8YVZ1_PLAOA|nr:hypothetical protein POVWA1_029560 [Plasmodium ovale wallikeri]SBT36267.1 hypothetical protein POVWA2_029300 [Plasmodium ovale wallikeri]